MVPMFALAMASGGGGFGVERGEGVDEVGEVAPSTGLRQASIQPMRWAGLG